MIELYDESHVDHRSEKKGESKKKNHNAPEETKEKVNYNKRKDFVLCTLTLAAFTYHTDMCCVYTFRIMVPNKLIKKILNKISYSDIHDCNRFPCNIILFTFRFYTLFK